MADSGNNKILWQREWHVSGTRSACEEIVESICKAIEESGQPDAAVFAVRLALEEALTNAVRHGHQGDESRRLGVDATLDTIGICIAVCDEGSGFDPGCVPDPTREENLMIASGRGLALMRAFMTEVHIEPPGNRIVMRYDLQQPLTSES
jgi:serine/threonine-protein kinase RsbW